MALCLLSSNNSAVKAFLDLNSCSASWKRSFKKWLLKIFHGRKKLVDAYDLLKKNLLIINMCNILFMDKIWLTNSEKSAYLKNISNTRYLTKPNSEGISFCDKCSRWLTQKVNCVHHGDLCTWEWFVVQTCKISLSASPQVERSAAWIHPYPDMTTPRSSCSAVMYKQYLVVAKGMGPGDIIIALGICL